MSKGRLPLTIDPFKFAEGFCNMQGTIAIGDMPRLQAECLAQQAMGEVDVSIEGGVDELGLRYLRGQIETDIPQICQRCLQPMNVHLKAKFALSPVHSEKEAKLLPSCYDVLYVLDEEVNLLEMIEEELLLVLPLIPKHDKKECKIVLSDDSKRGGLMEKSHPFARLKDKIKASETSHEE